jgi:hypothetical protein
MSAASAGTPWGPTAAGEAAVDDRVDHPLSPIDVITEGHTVVLAIAKCLDEAAGGALLDAASAAVDTGSHRIDVDLRALDSYTDEGARALVDCRDLSARLPEGLHYRTGRGPGRDALLSAYADVDPTYREG